MRFYIVRALLKKELRRHVANRGGIALALLMIVAAVLLSVFNPTAADSNSCRGIGLARSRQFVESTSKVNSSQRGMRRL